MASPHYEEFVSKLRVVERVPDGLLCFCPVHEANGEHNPSLLVSENDRGEILVHCRSVGCSSESIVAAVGCKMADLFPPKTADPHRPSSNGNGQQQQRVTDYYDYTDEDGRLLYQKQRLEPGKAGRKKDFRFRVPDGKGGWHYSIKGEHKPPRWVLYRLPAVVRAKPDVPILIVEGEKAVNYLGQRGFVATCNSEGATEPNPKSVKWKKGYTEQLRDRIVMVIPDSDKAGDQHAISVCSRLVGIARAVCRVDLPDTEKSWGVDDWLENGHSVEELCSLLRDAEPFESAEQVTGEAVERVDEQADQPADDLLAADRKILSDLGLSYVGERDGGAVLMFSRYCSKFATVSDVSKLSYTKLLQIVGPRAKVLVHQSSEDVPGCHRFRDVRDAIASVASVNQSDEDIRGIGVWPGEDGETYVVNRGEVLVIRPSGHCEISIDPHHGGKLYDVGYPKSWTELETLRNQYRQIDEPGRRDITLQLEQLVSRWKFKGEERCEIYPRILTGMILSTFIQTLWVWRPQVFIIGSPGSGKSLFVQTVAKLFGDPLTVISSGSTAAGIRISLGASAKVAICDEMEKSRNRRDILEMVRASGRGDNVIRGTSSQKANEFVLRQMFWCSSTESGLSEEADQARFLTFEIDHTPWMTKETDEALWRLGQRCLAVALRSYQQARLYIERLIENRPDGIHPRVCESFAVPVAMYTAATGGELGDAVQLLLRALKLVQEESGTIESDSNQLLQDILFQSVLLSGGKRERIIEMIRRHEFDPEFPERLAQVGISLSSDGNDIHFNRRLVSQYLLTDEWRGKRIDTILLRIPGAERSQKKFAKGSVVQTVKIPMDYLDDEPKGQEMF